MPSTPDSLLRLELQATGENANTWGTKTNNTIELLGQAIAGAANVNVGGSGNYTLVASNYVTDEARAATLVLTGTLSGNRDVIVPSSPKHYTIINQTSGAFPLTIRQVSGTGVAIPAGSSQIVCTSTTCVGVGINDVSRAGDTMTGALGFVVGSSTTPGLFPAGDTNTGFFQAAAAPDTLSVSVGGTEVARYGTGGFMRLADGTAAAPAYSFSGDTDTGIYGSGPNELAFATNGTFRGRFDTTGFQVNSQDGARFGSVGATSFARIGSSLNGETALDVSYDRAAGTANFSIGTVGGTFTERMRMTSGGAINMVGPVNVTSGNLNVTTGQLQVAGNPVQVQRGTEQATTSGTPIDFTGIPAGARRVIAILDDVSTNGSSILELRLGTSGGIQATGYKGNVASTLSNVAAMTVSTGLPVMGAGGHLRHAQFQMLNMSGNKWSISVVGGSHGDFWAFFGCATVTLSAALDRLRFVAQNGTDAFDAGAINIMWEF